MNTTVSVLQLAHCFKVTVRSINEWAAKGRSRGADFKLPRAKRGRYHLIHCIHWMIDELKHDATIERAGGQEAMRIKNEGERHRTRLLEIEVLEKEGELLPLDDILREIEPAIIALRQGNLGVQKKVEREYGPEVGKFVGDLINKSLNELSAIPQQLAGNKAPARRRPAKALQPAQTAAHAHRQPVGRRVSSAQSRSQRRKRPVGNKQS